MKVWGLEQVNKTNYAILGPNLNVSFYVFLPLIIVLEQETANEYFDSKKSEQILRIIKHLSGQNFRDFLQKFHFWNVVWMA